MEAEDLQERNEMNRETIERELRNSSVLRTILATQYVNCKATEKDFWRKLLNHAVELESGLQIARDSAPVEVAVKGEGFEVMG